MSRFVEFQNAGDEWGDRERLQQQAAQAQAEIAARRDWVPFSGFDPFTGGWEAKFVPPETALAIKNYELQMAHPGARHLEPFTVGMAQGMRAVKQLDYQAPESRTVKVEPKNAQAMPATDKGTLTELRKRLVQLNADIAVKANPAPSLISERDNLSRAIAAIESRYANVNQEWLVDPESIPFGAPKTTQFPQTRAEADALSMFGMPGERTPFVFSGGAQETPIPPPASRIRILNVRRR